MHARKIQENSDQALKIMLSTVDYEISRNFRKRQRHWKTETSEDGSIAQPYSYSSRTDIYDLVSITANSGSF